MKNLILWLLLFSSLQVFGQSNLSGFSYQAVVRTDDGKAFNNKEINVIIDLYDKDKENPIYTEEHITRTDQFGQINLVVGKGNSLYGSFEKTPWENANIYYKVQLINDQENLEIISEAELLAVPFALYAKTAGELKNDNSSSIRALEDHKFWTIVGNEVPEGPNLFGTLNRADVNIITANETRIRIASDGVTEFLAKTGFYDLSVFFDNVQLNKNLKIEGEIETGGNALIGGSLTVNKETTINEGLVVRKDLDVFGDSRLVGGMIVGGAVDLNGGLTVGQMKPSYLTGILTVDKDTKLNSTLDVSGATLMKSTLKVEGEVTLDSKLLVEGFSIFNDDLTVNGISTLNDRLVVSKDVPQGNYVASFENTNNGNGDGINIKLGKSKTIYAPPSLPSLLSNSQLNDIKNLIRCDYNGNKVNLLGNIVLEGLQADVEMIAGLAVGTGNLIIDFINSKLSLPLKISQGSIIGSINLFYLNLGALGTVDVNLPALPPSDITLLPAIPTLDLSFLGISPIPINDLNFWGVPNICLSDSPGSSPLNNENEFIRFSDNNDAKMGSIRAVSLTDWSSDYLNPVYLFGLHGALTSAVDKKHGRYHFKQEVGKAIKAYAAIGVEYSSGNGDYAEWLPRTNENEKIYAGEIVAVKGGKISKDLTNAEQVMVVSHNPIVLGNTPDVSRVHEGNNIAFMGQVPVKIMGPVRTGDYIVADPNIPGYGFARNEYDMTIEDFKFAVGRSWDQNESEGPKMVNTVVGIHNGDYTKILKNMERKFDESESRLETLESKVEVLAKYFKDESKNN